MLWAQPWPSKPTDLGGPRDVAGPHRHGEAQREAPGLVAHRLLVFDGHQHPFPGAYVGHGVAEEVGAELFGQGRRTALVAGGLVGGAGLGLLLDLALDDPLADGQPQVVHRRVLGQREDVDAVQPIGAGVAEALADPDPGHQPGDLDLDIGVQGRDRVEAPGLAGLDQELAGPGRVRGHAADPGSRPSR